MFVGSLEPAAALAQAAAAGARRADLQLSTPNRLGPTLDLGRHRDSTRNLTPGTPADTSRRPLWHETRPGRPTARLRCPGPARAGRASAVPRSSISGPMDDRLQTASETGGRASTPVVTGVNAAAYMMTVMDAARTGQGVNAEKLAADAIAAQRGDRAAQNRLYRVLRPTVAGRPRLLASRVGAYRRSAPRRPSRRAGRVASRARSPGRRDPGQLAVGSPGRRSLERGPLTQRRAR